jgi:hypothetical protein
VIRHREVDTSSPEGPGFNFLDADLNEALRKIQVRPAQFASVTVRLTVASWARRRGGSQPGCCARAASGHAAAAPASVAKNLRLPMWLAMWTLRLGVIHAMEGRYHASVARSVPKADSQVE